MRIANAAGGFRSGVGVRRGLTLVEVLVALTIFLFSIIAIYRLTDIATDNAKEIVNQSRATRLMESKMADFVAGVEPLSGGGGGQFDDEPGWSWNADIETDAVTNLYKVTITVSKDGSDANPVSAKLTQYILDPTQRGVLTVQTGTTPTGNNASADNNVTVNVQGANSGSGGSSGSSGKSSSTGSSGSGSSSSSGTSTKSSSSSTGSTSSGSSSTGSSSSGTSGKSGSTGSSSKGG